MLSNVKPKANTAVEPMTIWKKLYGMLKLNNRLWLELPWLLALIAGFAFQFYLGYKYNSNETTNIYLQIGRGSAYVLLLALVVFWLPVMRHSLAALWRSRWTAWLPLEQAKNVHRWLGHMMIIFALTHGSTYLLYFNTLEEPFLEVLLGTESDMVRSMKTTMYEFVSEDESIDEVQKWIDNGMPKDDFHATIRPIMKEDCTKCHSTDSTMTYAYNDLPLSSYEDVVSLSDPGMLSRQFRINMTGMLMLLIFTLVWYTSLRFMRMKRHSLFQQVHKLGYLLAILALLHIPRYDWIIVPCLILAVEYFLSHYARVYRGQLANLKRANNDTLVLEMPCPDGFDLALGHYLQLRIPALKRYEWHDFSLTGSKADKNLIVLKIKLLGDWTGDMFDLLQGQEQCNVVVDIRGPFATPAARLKSSDQCIMVAGGIGITPFLSCLNAILFKDIKVNQFHLIWVLRDSQLLSWLEPILSSPMVSGGKVHIYLTKEENDKQLPQYIEQSLQQDITVIKHQRPDWTNLFDDLAKELNKPKCYVCGPDAMTNSVSQQCKKQGWQLSIEKF